LLRHRSFRLYFVGSLASNLGTWLQNTAQVLLAYQITHSVFAVGLVVSAQFAGILVLSPWAAVIADRLGSRLMLIGTQVVSAGIAGWMAWSYHLHMLDERLLVVGALGLGLAFSLALPLQTALVPTLVESADTEAAMAMNSVSYNSGRALAPALCVLVLAFIGPDWIFGLNAGSFAIFAVVLARLNFAACGKPSSARPDGHVHEPPRRTRATDGFKTVLEHRRLLLLLAIVAAVTLADDPILVLSPALVHATLHASSDWAGYFIAALGWGSVLGSLPPTSRRVIDSRRLSKRAAYSLLVLGISVVVFSAGWSIEISLIAAFVAGAAALFTGAAAQTLIVGNHKNVATSVAALWAIAWAGTKPLASLLDGWLASDFGIWKTGITLAFPAIILALCEVGLPEKRKQRIKDSATRAFNFAYPDADPSRS
jgi:MFS family permease